MRRGVQEYFVYIAANSRKGYWFTVETGAVKRAMKKERLTRAGFFEIPAAYESLRPAYIGYAVY